MDGLPSAAVFAARLAATCALASLLTWRAIHYARSRSLIDLPGQRRSHRVPTPRGGGIAIVAAILVLGLLPGVLRAHGTLPVDAGLLALAVVAVALVGWLDDHGGLSARLRLMVHCVAAALVFAVPLLHAMSAGPDPAPVAGLAMFAAVLVTLAIAWSVNLHNFMDGIDGLLAMQALFCLSVFAWLLARAGDVGPALAAGTAAAAVLGFLPFNFPRARIFMGDVGSGALGLAIALAAISLAGHSWVAAATGAVVVSAFVTDATCTLLSRMLRGRRWYSAHREHLYQWLVRSGFSHAQVVALYMAWNLLLVLPVVYWMNRSAPSPVASVGIVAAVYASAAALWWRGKRWCLAAVSGRAHHAA